MVSANKIDAKGSVERTQDSRTKPMVSAKDNIESVHELFLSQENQPVSLYTSINA